MNMQLLHDISFYLLYACLAVVTFVIIERAIFFIMTVKDMRLVGGGARQEPEFLDRPGVLPQALKAFNAEHDELTTDPEKDALMERHYIAARGQFTRHLWLLDTVVTAAPLLGLLGTILGIIETFTALAQSGISDPAGVSSGIGTALFATALGIGTALYALLFFNLFQERVERACDATKSMLLRAGERKPQKLRALAFPQAAAPAEPAAQAQPLRANA